MGRWECRRRDIERERDGNRGWEIDVGDVFFWTWSHAKILFDLGQGEKNTTIS